MANQTKRFQFFNQETIAENLEVAPSSESGKKVPVVDMIHHDGMFFFSNKNGTLFEWSNGEPREAILIYSRTFMYMFKVKIEYSTFLVTYGVDRDTNLSDDAKTSSIKIWDIYRLRDKPIRTIVIQEPGNPLLDVASLAVSPDLTHIALGLLPGQIYLVRSNSSLVNCREKDIRHRIIEENAKSHTVVNVHFAQDPIKKVTVLYSTTATSTSCFRIQEKSEQRAILHEDQGCFTKCSDVSPIGDLVIGAQDMKAIIQYKNFQPGPAWSFEGEIQVVRAIGSQIAIVSNVDNKNTLTIYDPINHIVSLISIYLVIQHIYIDHNVVYAVILTTRKELNLIKLTEIDTSEKLRSLMKRSFYDVALKIAQNAGYSPEVICNIHKKNADHLYNKGDFASSIEYYKMTVDYLEPSYVINKFLDAQKIDYLITYLEKIPKNKISDKDHTSLQLNCYVKQKKIAKLEEFVGGNVNHEAFDIETAIKVCKESNRLELAEKLALQCKDIDTYLKIQVEDRQDYRKALRYMKDNLQGDELVKAFKELGQILMKYQGDFAVDVIKSELCGKYEGFKPQEILHIFVENIPKLQDFLEFYIRDHSKSCSSVLYHRLFEVYIEEWAQATIKVEQTKKDYLYQEEINQLESSIMSLLRDPKSLNKYDKTHVLMLFKLYHFSKGILYLYEKMELKQELLEYYMETRNYQNIIGLCKENDGDQDLWVQALTYFVDENNLDKITEMLQILENRDILSPLLVLKILDRNQKLPFSIVKQYIKKKVRVEKQIIEEEEIEVHRSNERSRKMRGEIRDSQTTAKVFQHSKCNQCDLKLNLPSIHFMCGHSFHEHCLLNEDEKICQKCGPDMTRVLDRKSQYDKKTHDHGQFFRELDGQRVRFNAVVDYFGRGLFSNPENGPIQLLKKAQ